MRVFQLIIFSAVFVFAFAPFLSVHAADQDRLHIFACAPEWGALAREIGGEKVDVFVASKAAQDVHHMRAKPSLLAAMRRADFVLCSGASLEIGWLPVLLNKAGKSEVQYGDVGSLMAADYVDKLEVMSTVDRSMGHVHPEGNPHIHLDPRNILIVSGILAEMLADLDPGNAAYFESRSADFKKRWSSSIRTWEKAAAPLKGKNVVVYHNSWVYLLHWLGMHKVASLEPKPGIPPTAAHLERVLQDIQGKDVSGILVAPFENEEAAQWLSKKTGIPVLHLPFTVGADDTSSDLFSLFDDTVSILNQGQ